MSSFPPPPPPPSGGSYAAKKFPPPPPSSNNTNNKGLPPGPSPNKTMMNTPRGSSTTSGVGGPQKFPPPPPSSGGMTPRPNNSNNVPPTSSSATPLSRPPNANNSMTTGNGPASPSPVRPFGYQTPVNNNSNNTPSSSAFPPRNNNNANTSGMNTPRPSLATPNSNNTAGKSFLPPPPPSASSQQKKLPPNPNPNTFKKPAPILRDINNSSQNNNNNQHSDPFSSTSSSSSLKNKEPPKMLPAKTSAGIGQTITHLKSNNNNRNNNSPHQQQQHGGMGTASHSGGLKSPSDMSFNASFDGGSVSNSTTAFDPSTDKLPPLILPTFPPPVSICVSGNGQVIQTSTSRMEINSSSLFDILKSSEYDVGRSYALSAESVTNALQVNDKENLTTKPELVLKAVEDLGNSRSDLLATKDLSSPSSSSSSGNNHNNNSSNDNILTQVLKHMISNGAATKNEDIGKVWAKDTVSAYVPMLERYSNQETTSSLPCPRIATSSSDTSAKNDENNNDQNEPFNHHQGNSSANNKNQASREIQNLIISGDRAKAVSIAIENGLYAEALLTAMLCDKDVFENAVQTFVEHNVDRSSPLGQAFLLFNELPLSPPEALNVDHWAHHIKMLLCNYSAAGLANGVTNWSDALLQKGLVDEAHLCLLLLQQSPAWQNPNIVPDNIRNRIHLIGGVYKRQGCRKAFVNFRSLYLSDAMEYSKQRSINEKFIRPPLIPFKLAHGLILQELGLLEKAGTYFDAVTRILAPGTPKQLLEPKVCWTRASTAQVPTCLVQLNEACKYTLNEYFKTLEGKAGSAAGNGTSASGGGILGWFGIGGARGGNNNSNSAKQPTTNNNANNNNIRSASAPAPRPQQQQQQQQHEPEQNNNNDNLAATTTTTSSSSNNAKAPAARSQSQSRVAGLFSSIGGLFRRGASAGNNNDQDPPPKAMILDSEPVPEWDPVNKCYKRILTEEEKRIEEMTKKGPPKVDPRGGPSNNNTNNNNNNGLPPTTPSSNISSNNNNGGNFGGGGAPNNNNNNMMMTGQQKMMMRPGAGGGGNGRPPPPPQNRNSAAGRSRYADLFNG